MIPSKETLDKLSRLADKARQGRYDESNVVNILKDIDDRYYFNAELITEDNTFKGMRILDGAILAFSTKKKKWIPVRLLKPQDKADAIQQIWNAMNIQLSNEIDENL